MGRKLYLCTKKGRERKKAMKRLQTSPSKVSYWQFDNKHNIQQSAIHAQTELR